MTFGVDHLSSRFSSVKSTSNVYPISKMTCEENDSQQNEQSFIERVKNLIEQKCEIKLDDYINVQSLFELGIDLLQLYTCLRSLKDDESALGKIGQLWQKHSQVLLPVFQQGMSSIASLTTDKKARKKAIEVLFGLVHKITNGLNIVPAMNLITQCGELWSIRELIAQAMSEVTDKKIRNDFELIDANIQKLKLIATELDALIGQFEKTNDVVLEQDLLNQIKAQLKMAEPYKDTSNLIVNLREKIGKNQGILAKCSAHLHKININSMAGTVTALLLLASPAIPIVLPIAGAAFSVTMGAGAFFANAKIKSKLVQYEQRMTRLEKYETELDETLRQIEQLKLRRDEIIRVKIETKERAIVRKSFRKRAIVVFRKAVCIAPNKEIANWREQQNQISIGA